MDSATHDAGDDNSGVAEGLDLGGLEFIDGGRLIEAALALLKKFGFVQEVCRRKALERDGQRWDLYVFGLLCEEWLGQAKG